ncbi:hypothetical protein JNUCC42_16600 [Brevibacterium sp. JNUCC-42]|nr:hypothetical protein JNUCC42_16600 [Brevibacterium sp. JNUCC-42]
MSNIYGFTWGEVDDAQALRQWAESRIYSNSPSSDNGQALPALPNTKCTT